MKLTIPPPISLEVTEKMRALIRLGASQGDVIKAMRDERLHIVECIKLTSLLYEIPLGVAKDAVHSSDAWQDTREQNEAFHTQAVQALEDTDWQEHALREQQVSSTAA